MYEKETVSDQHKGLIEPNKSGVLEVLFLWIFLTIKSEDLESWGSEPGATPLSSSNSTVE